MSKLSMRGSGDFYSDEYDEDAEPEIDLTRYQPYDVIIRERTAIGEKGPIIIETIETYYEPKDTPPDHKDPSKEE